MRVQGGTSGLISALLAGRVDPLSGESIGREGRWPSGRRNWYDAARRERRERRETTKAERYALGRIVLAIPDLLA